MMPKECGCTKKKKVMPVGIRIAKIQKSTVQTRVVNTQTVRKKEIVAEIPLGFVDVVCCSNCDATITGSETEGRRRKIVDNVQFVKLSLLFRDERYTRSGM